MVRFWTPKTLVTKAPPALRVAVFDECGEARGLQEYAFTATINKQLIYILKIQLLDLYRLGEMLLGVRDKPR